MKHEFLVLLLRTLQIDPNRLSELIDRTEATMAQSLARSSVHRTAFGWCTLAALTLVLSACSEPISYDLILRGGTIVDGTDGESYVGDVAISGDRIAAIGDLGAASAIAEIDVTGLVVAPGFINIHSHATSTGLSTATNMLSQGMTTEILNADGSGRLDLSAQLNALQEEGLAVNVGGMIGFNTVWREAVGLEDVRPTPAQILEMRTCRISLKTDSRPVPGVCLRDSIMYPDTMRPRRKWFRYWSHLPSGTWSSPTTTG